MKKSNGSGSQKKRIDWEDDPRIRAVATSVGPAAAKAVRRIRDAMNGPQPKDSLCDGITDKGVLCEAVSIGLAMLARRHLRDPRVWKAGAGVWDADEDDVGTYVPVFRRYVEDDVQLEREEARAAAERAAARRRTAKVIQLFGDRGL